MASSAIVKRLRPDRCTRCDFFRGEIIAVGRNMTDDCGVGDVVLTRSIPTSLEGDIYYLDYKDIDFVEVKSK
jgi:hypothetical protein